MKRGLGYLVALLMFLGVSGNLWAQTNSGTILGTVKDESGAVVPGANIQLTDQNRGFQRSTTTNASGDYRFDFVPNGTYGVAATMEGFNKYEQIGINLLIRQTLRVDIPMKLGRVAQTITVSGQAPVVNSETATMSENVDKPRLDKYVASEINSFSASYDLLHYSVDSVDQTQGVEKVNGLTDGQRRTTIDGQVVDNYYNGLAFGGIEEAKIIDTNAPAEYALPVTVALVTKGGDNTLHGSAEYNFGSVALNALGPYHSVRAHAKTNWNMGFEGSGPVVIPKIYNGKDRTFWFFDYERQHSTFNAGFDPQDNVPTLGMRAGDFSNLKDSSGNVIPIYDPRTGQQFPGNMIPTDRISPVALKIENSPFYPVPNQGNPNNPVQNWHGDPSVPYANGASHIWSFRVDQKITHNDTVNFSYSQWISVTSVDDAAGPVNPIVQNVVWGLEGYYQYAPSLGWTHIFNPHMVNEFRVGFDRLYIPTTTTKPSGASILQQWGLQGANAGTLAGTPIVTVSGLVGTDNWFGDQQLVDNRYNVIDNVTMQHGHHAIKVGFNLLRLQRNFTGYAYNSGSPYGSYGFNNLFTANPVTGAGGNSWADLLLGLPSGVSVYTPRSQVAGRGVSTGYYVEDSWKVTPRLTLDLGLRWDVEGVPYERNGLFYSWDPATGGLVFPTQYAMNNVSPLFNKAVPLELASSVGYPAHLLDHQWGNFAPRIGIAFRPFNDAKTVVRAGYGVYINDYFGAASRGSATSGVNTGGPFALSESFQSQRGATLGSDPTLTFPNPYPSGPGAASAFYSIGATAPTTFDGRTYQYNVAIEREWWGTAFKLAYVGDRSLGMPYSMNLDQVPASTIPYSTSGCGTITSMAQLPAPTCRRNYPYYTGASWGVNGFSDYYDSMQFKVARPMSHGLWLQSGWIWGNERGDLGSPDPYNQRLGWGEVSGNPRQRLVLGWVYNLPFGVGQPYNFSIIGNKFAKGVVTQVLGGWSVSGAWSFLSGFPFSVSYSGTDPSGTGHNSGNPDRIASGICNPAPCSNGLWLNPNAFQRPANDIGRFGNEGNNVFTGPAFQRTDMSMFKDFPFPIGGRESAKIRLMVSMNDPFNSHGLVITSANFSDPTNFGKLQAGAGGTPGSSAGNGGGWGNYVRTIVLDGRLFF